MKKFLAMTAAALLATTTLASAATLNFVSGNDADRLRVQGPAQVTYTVLSVESIPTISENYLTVAGSGSVNSVGQVITRNVNQGTLSNTILSFILGSNQTGLSFLNSTGTLSTDPDQNLFAKIRFTILSATSVLAEFEDGRDSDYGEMSVRIDVAAIPVPAAGLLLLSGLGGLGLMRRRKKA